MEGHSSVGKVEYHWFRSTELLAPNLTCPSCAANLRTLKYHFDLFLLYKVAVLYHLFSPTLEALALCCAVLACKVLGRD